MVKSARRAHDRDSPARPADPTWHTLLSALFFHEGFAEKPISVVWAGHPGATTLPRRRGDEDEDLRSLPHLPSRLGLATLRKTLPPAKGPALQLKLPSSGALLRLIKMGAKRLPLPCFARTSVRFSRRTRRCELLWYVARAASLGDI